MQDNDVPLTVRPKYPHIDVRLSSGVDSNAMAIVVACQRQMRRAGIKQPELDEFRIEATSGDYDNVIQTCMKWVNVL